MAMFNFGKKNIIQEDDNSDLSIAANYTGLINIFKKMKNKMTNKISESEANQDGDILVEPLEDYKNNEELASEPKYSACIDTRAIFLNYNGFEVINKDNPEEENDDIKKIKEMLMERLDIDGNVDMIQINNDNHGNFYCYLNWADILEGENNVIGEDIVSVSYIEQKFIRPIIDKDSGNIKAYAYSPEQDFARRKTETNTGYEILELKEVIHFKNIQRRPSTLAESLIFPLKETLSNKKDLHKRMPVIIKHYAKPYINYSIKCEHGRVKNNSKVIKLIREQTESMLKKMEPDSDTILPDYIEPKPVSTTVSYPEKLIDDLDNDIYGKTKVPESFFKSSGTTDLKITAQEKNFLRVIDRLQKNFEDTINKQFIDIYKKVAPDIKNREANYVMKFNKVNINDLALRSNVANSAYGGGFITGNEARTMIGLPTKEGMDNFNKVKEAFETPENNDPNAKKDVNEMEVKNELPDKQKKTQIEKNTKKSRGR